MLQTLQTSRFLATKTAKTNLEIEQNDGLGMGMSGYEWEIDMPTMLLFEASDCDLPHVQERAKALDAASQKITECQTRELTIQELEAQGNLLLREWVSQWDK